MEFSLDHDWCAVVIKLLGILFSGTVDTRGHPSIEVALLEIALLHKAVRRNCRPMKSNIYSENLISPSTMAFSFGVGPKRSSQSLLVPVLFVLFIACLSFGSVVSDEGATLLEIKKSFRDVDNVLYDWTDSPSSDYCV